MGIATPVMKDAASEIKNSMRGATSVGSAALFIARKLKSKAAPRRAADWSSIGVLMGPLRTVISTLCKYGRVCSGLRAKAVDTDVTLA